MPDLYKIMKEKFYKQSKLIYPSWYMSLFSAVLPFNLFLRVFDIFLIEGWKILYRVSFTILKLLKN
jgi:hypothetical protein